MRHQVTPRAQGIAGHGRPAARTPRWALSPNWAASILGDFTPRPRYATARHASVPAARRKGLGQQPALGEPWSTGSVASWLPVVIRRAVCRSISSPARQLVVGRPAGRSDFGIGDQQIHPETRRPGPFPSAQRPRGDRGETLGHPGPRRPVAGLAVAHAEPQGRCAVPAVQQARLRRGLRRAPRPGFRSFTRQRIVFLWATAGAGNLSTTHS